MRHSVWVKTTLCLPLFLATCVLADETADRAAIERTIAGLNELPRRAALFTADANGLSELERLPKAAPDPPTVTISHEPWGEATLHLPGVGIPRIVGGGIRFITPDVALAEATWIYSNGTATAQTAPLLLVMKKEGENWKIAALRVLAPR